MAYTNTITTNRLITRKLVYEDHVAWARFFGDTETAKFITTLGETDHTKRATAWINKQLTRYANNEGGLQALIHKSTGEFIGQCGILRQEIDGVSELEIGYHVFPQFRGQGYATEAATGFKQYVFENIVADSIISIIHKDNIASQKVALKNGMAKEKESQFYGMPVYVYRITLEAYEKAHAFLISLLHNFRVSGGLSNI